MATVPAVRKATMASKIKTEIRRSKKALRASLKIAEPGCNDKMEIGEKFIENPFCEFKTHIRVSVNFREHPVAYLRLRKLIGEDQEHAADRFRRLYETTAKLIGQGIDPTKEHVDGGKFAEPISEQRWRAGKELAAVRAFIGPSGYALLEAVCGEGHNLIDIADAQGRSSDRGKRYVGERFREVLAELAYYWNYRGRVEKVA